MATQAHSVLAVRCLLPNLRFFAPSMTSEPSYAQSLGRSNTYSADRAGKDLPMAKADWDLDAIAGAFATAGPGSVTRISFFALTHLGGALFRALLHCRIRRPEIPSK